MKMKRVIDLNLNESRSGDNKKVFGYPNKSSTRHDNEE